MPIKKKWLSREEFLRIQGGTWVPPSHTLASHSTKAHSELTGVTSDLHHAKVHNVLSAAHGDALVASRVRGDLLVANATPKWSRLAKGMAGQYLRSNGTDILWVTMVAGDLPNHAPRHKKTGADEIKLDEFGEPTDNTNLNVDIHRHGLFPKLINDYQKFYSAVGQWTKLVGSTGPAVYVLSKSGAITRNSNDTERFRTEDPAYEKIKEIKMDEPTGIMKVYWEFRADTGNGTAYTKVYVNGVAKSSERSTTETTYQEESYILPSNLALNDLVQIYAYNTGSPESVYVRNMRLQYDRAIIKFGDWEITSAGYITTVTQTAFLTTNQDP